jgi:hypothetical protein
MQSALFEGGGIRQQRGRSAWAGKAYVVALAVPGETRRVLTESHDLSTGCERRSPYDKRNDADCLADGFAQRFSTFECDECSFRRA